MSAAFIRAWLRTFAVQSSWNYERMLGTGVAYAAAPLLASLGDADGESRRAEALGRSAAYFNAHPYMAAMVVGAQARAEHEMLPPAQILRLRRALMAPLGSVGDKLIWAGALPFAVGLGLLLQAAVSPIVGAATFLVLYNAIHLTVRTWALASGWQLGTRVARALSGRMIQGGLRVAGPLSGLALGLAIPVTVEWVTGDLAFEARIGAVAVAGLGLFLSRWLAPTWGGLRYGLVTCFLAGVVGWIWR